MWLVPYAVDNDLFEHRTREASARRAELQAELNLDPTRPVLLFASKLQPRKRVLDLLDAYFALTPNHEPHPYLLIVGDGEDRPTLEARIAQAASKGIHSIRLCGFRNQSELPRFFDLATVFVLPSHNEPWGLVVNEAMASGTPVILSNEVGCHPDLLTDDIEGYLFPAGNLPALTEALHKILEDSERAARMGQNALTRIRPWSIEADIRGLRHAIAAVTHTHAL
jgi:glycosyltransferase involved in cell wall biosynthesis